MCRLTIALILVIFDLEREAILETNTSNYTIDVCLTQKRNDDKMQIIAFYIHKMTKFKLNYDIYNKELLIIVEALCE